MSKPKVAPGNVAVLSTNWRETVLICRKCSKKLAGGFGADGKATLRTALRATLRALGKRRSVRIVETGCFGICPKKAVTVARGTVPGELLVIGKGTDPAILLNRGQLQGGEGNRAQ